MDGDANFVRVEISRLEEAYIVSRHHRQTARFRELHRRMQVRLFILAAGTDQLKEITVWEMFFIKTNALLHQRHITAQQGTPDVTHTAAGQQNKPLFQLK